MADAVLLSTETFNHLRKWLDDYGNGFEHSIQFGKGLKVEERGTDYLKIGIDPNELPNSNVPSSSNLNLNVTDGTNTVTNVRTLNFIGTLFSVTGSNGNFANITLKTESCP